MHSEQTRRENRPGETDREDGGVDTLPRLLFPFSSPNPPSTWRQEHLDPRNKGPAVVVFHVYVLANTMKLKK